jgi:[ribosomal protein S5]-alanine N-acetyltransferase
MNTFTILPPVATPHLILREMEFSDGRELSRYMVQPRYQKFIAHRLKDENEVLAFVRRNVAGQADVRRRIFHLVAEEIMSGEVVGDTFLIAHNDHSHEIGWGVHPALWRMGFGVELGRAMLSMAFERINAKSVWCKVMTSNVASSKLAQRIGMRLDKTHTRMSIGQGRVEDVEIYRMTSDDYFDLPY